MLGTIETSEFKMTLVDGRKTMWLVEVEGDFEAFRKFITMIRLHDAA